MKALILRNESASALNVSRLLMEKGFQILSVQSLATAKTLARVETIDLLVMDELVDGQMTHSVALSAERRNPDLCVIAYSARSAEETDDLFELVPSLYAVVGQQVSSAVLAQLVMSSVHALASRLSDPLMATPPCAIATAPAYTRRDNTKIAQAKAEFDLALTEIEPLVATPLALEHFNDPQEQEPTTADILFAAPAMRDIATQGAANKGLAEELSMIGTKAAPRAPMDQRYIAQVLG